MNLFKQNGIKISNSLTRQANAYRQKIRNESRVGGSVFGPVPEVRRREFICLDEKTWLWHEEWRDDQGKLHAVTTKYDIRPNGIIKTQNGIDRTVTADEALNLLQAARNYKKMVHEQLYSV